MPHKDSGLHWEGCRGRAGRGAGARLGGGAGAGLGGGAGARLVGEVQEPHCMSVFTHAPAHTHI